MLIYRSPTDSTYELTKGQPQPSWPLSTFAVELDLPPEDETEVLYSAGLAQVA